MDRQDISLGASSEAPTHPDGQYSDTNMHTNLNYQQNIGLAKVPDDTIMWANMFAHEQIDHGIVGDYDTDGTGDFTDKKVFDWVQLESLPSNYGSKFMNAVQGN